MADKFQSKGVSIPIYLDAKAAVDAVGKFGTTLQKLSSGISLNEYFKESAELINDLRDAWRQFEHESSSFGSVNDETAENLVKISNAVQGFAIAAKVDIHQMVPEFEQMGSAIASAVKQTGTLTHVFDTGTFADAYRTLTLLKNAGLDLDEVFKKIGQNTDLSWLYDELERTRNELAWAKSDAENYRRELEELNETDVGELQGKLDRLKTAAKNEVLYFFRANNIPMNAESGYTEAIDAIENFGSTSSRVITDWKKEYGYLLGQSAKGTGSVLDPSLFDELVNKMQPFMDKLTELEGLIQNGGGVGNNNAGAVNEIVTTLENSGKAADGAVELVTALERLAGSDNLEGLKRVLSTLGGLDKISIRKSSLDNLETFINSATHVKDLSSLAALSTINLSGFNNLNIRKTSLENLATYLPMIARTDVDQLQALTSLPLDKLSNLTLKLDLGKERFKTEAEDVKALNAAFREHAGIVNAAVAAEGRKYEASVQLTDQLNREKQALGETENLDGEGSSKKLRELYSERMHFEKLIAAAENEKIGKNQDEQKAIQDRITFLDSELNIITKQIDGYRQKAKYAKQIKELDAKAVERQLEEETKKPITRGKQSDAADVRAMNAKFAEIEEAYGKQVKLEADLKTATGQRRVEIEKALNEQRATVATLEGEVNQYSKLVEYSERAAQSASKRQTAERNATHSGDIKVGGQTDKDNAAWDKLLEKFNKLSSSSNKFKTDYDALRQDIQAHNGTLEEANRRYEELKQRIDDADKATKDGLKAQKEQESAALTYDKLTNKVTAYFHKFESEIKRSPTLMSQYNQLLNTLGTQGFGKTKDGATKAAAEVQKFQIACEQAGVGANSFIKKLVSGFGNKLLYGGLAKLAAEIRKLARQIYTNVKEIDSAATQLRIVTKGSAADMKSYYDDAAESAKRLAVSIKDVIESTTTFARLGYSAKDSNLLAEYTSMLTKVGNIDTQSATNAVTALVKAFDLDLSDVQLVMDQMVEVGNNFPISVAELAEGVNNAGSALASANNTVEQSFALLTAANTTVQDISKASTALRTMAARIRRTTSEEMPEGEEAITESKYNDLVKSLTKYKVSLVDVNNEYRSTYDIIKDISSVWDQMSSMEQAAIQEAISGTRNQNVFASLVNQFREAEGAMSAAQNAGGAMSQAYEAYLDSIEGHAGKLKADFEDLSTTILDSDVLKFGIDVVDTLVTIIDDLAEIKILLPAIFAIIASINAVGRPENEGFQPCAHLDFAREGYISELVA